ncbi:Hypothetical protein CINCED_3A007306 [Cinara cedri]|uniref:Uncharacterized protein n=1 Tax=Cinara cedri TaxID=506608 RepID=A0A5E4M142_9HEMI|nr:Hypothetical protein CINCED_3A007306 [Cinara cedri]
MRPRNVPTARGVDPRNSRGRLAENGRFEQRTPAPGARARVHLCPRIFPYARLTLRAVVVAAARPPAGLKSRVAPRIPPRAVPDPGVRGRPGHGEFAFTTTTYAPDRAGAGRNARPFLSPGFVGASGADNRRTPATDE